MRALRGRCRCRECERSVMGAGRVSRCVLRNWVARSATVSIRSENRQWNAKLAVPLSKSGCLVSQAISMAKLVVKIRPWAPGATKPVIIQKKIRFLDTKMTKIVRLC